MAVKPGQIIELTISSISHQGEGVAKLNGYTVFVPFTAPGDVVQGQVFSAKKGYARALVKQLLQPGQRVVPPCPWFGSCGGCDLQHLDYELQLAIKTETVKSTLSRIGGISPAIVQTILPSRAWNYRNKLQMPVAMLQGRLTAGLYRARSHDLVPVEECLIQHDANNRIAQTISAICREIKILSWDEKKQNGALKHIIVRHAEATGETLAVLVVSRFDFPGRAALEAKVQAKLPQLTSLVLSEYPYPTNVVLGAKEQVVWGPGYISDDIGGLKFKISPRTFWQVNPHGASVVYQQVKKYAGLSGRETVLDIYCGAGSIGLFLAAKAGKVIGIESNTTAIKDARDNAAFNGITNAKFYPGMAEDRLPKLVERGLKADVIVLDPPRKGCEAALLEAVTRAGAERIVYVSCNPATLARDLKLLAEMGYMVREIQPVDMFPQTSHVETVVLMSRKG